MKLERKMSKKRGLLGYNQKEVRRVIQSLQEEHQDTLKNLKQEIEEEKGKKLILMTKLEECPQQPDDNHIAEEITAALYEHFIEQTKSILKVTAEMKEKEKILLERLEQKIKQKGNAQKRIRDVLEYLNRQKSELEKELIR